MLDVEVRGEDEGLLFVERGNQIEEQAGEGVSPGHLRFAPGGVVDGPGEATFHSAGEPAGPSRLAVGG